MAALVLLGVVAVLYLKHRRREISRKGSEINALQLPSALTYTPFVTGSGLSGASGTPSASLTTSTLPLNPSARTTLNTMPSIHEAQRGPRMHKGYAVQSPPAAGHPPTNLSNDAVVNRVSVQIRNEPVEEGLMTRQISTGSSLPHYGFGGTQ